VDWSERLNRSENVDELMLINSSNGSDINWPIEKCPNGWEYNTTNMNSTIVIDVNYLYFGSFIN